VGEIIEIRPDQITDRCQVNSTQQPQLNEIAHKIISFLHTDERRDDNYFLDILETLCVRYVLKYSYYFFYATVR